MTDKFKEESVYNKIMNERIESEKAIRHKLFMPDNMTNKIKEEILDDLFSEYPHASVIFRDALSDCLDQYATAVLKEVKRPIIGVLDSDISDANKLIFIKDLLK